MGLKIKLLLLDHGFYSVSVISYLKKVRQPFLMPQVIRGNENAEVCGDDKAVLGLVSFDDA